MKLTPPKIFGGMLALGVLWQLLRKDSDVDALARMLISETSFDTSKHSAIEMAQIVYVALNRARKTGASLSQVVQPGGRWNGGDLYTALFGRASSNPRWAEARAFVGEVLGGAYPNMGFSGFIHPGSMPRPPCAPNRVEADTLAGRRCIPQWSIGGTVVGRGQFVA